MLCGATKDSRVMVERSDRMWSTGEGNGRPLQYSCPESPMNSMRRQNDRILKEKLPRSVGAQYATGDQWRNNCRKNEGRQSRQKQHPVVNGTGDGSRVWCCKEQYCIGTWNVRSMNQGKLEVVKQMTRVNINILGMSELRWTGMGEFNSDNQCIYYCGQKSLRRNGVAIIVNKRVRNEIFRLSQMIPFSSPIQGPRVQMPIWYWENHFLGRLLRSPGVPKERGVWNSQGGRKDKLFFPSTFLRII